MSQIRPYPVLQSPRRLGTSLDSMGLAADMTGSAKGQTRADPTP